MLRIFHMRAVSLIVGCGLTFRFGQEAFSASYIITVQLNHRYSPAEINPVTICRLSEP